jgi:hypothetical protein
MTYPVQGVTRLILVPGEGRGANRAHPLGVKASGHAPCNGLAARAGPRMRAVVCVAELFEPKIVQGEGHLVMGPMSLRAEGTVTRKTAQTRTIHLVLHLRDEDDPGYLIEALNDQGTSRLGELAAGTGESPPGSVQGQGQAHECDDLSQPHRLAYPPSA